MLGRAAALDYYRAQAFKYIWRCRDKDNTTEDLEKAGYYINQAIDLLKKETAWQAQFYFGRLIEKLEQQV